MTVEQTKPSTAAEPRADRRAEILIGRDLAMMATACKYNLADKAEGQRSVRDLSRLFFHLAKSLGVDLFIEAGAKDAESSRQARRMLSPKRVVAFEANPFVHQRFAKANRIASVEYEHLALTDKPGTVTFNVRRAQDGTPLADGQASLLKRADESATGFVEVAVKATTLDAYFRGYDFERAALWIDVEGASHAVLSGGCSVLDKAAVVIIEVEDRRYWGEDQWLRPDVLSFLYDRGLVPVARDFQSRYLYNIVLVRSDLLETVDRVRWAITLFSSTAYNAAPDGTRATPSAPWSATRAASRVRHQGRKAVNRVVRKVRESRLIRLG